MAFIRPYPPVIYTDKSNTKLKHRFHNGKHFTCEHVTDDLNAALQFKAQVSKTGANTFRLKKTYQGVDWYFIFVNRGVESTFEPNNQENVTD